jgi:hypothetical protein
VGNKREEIKKKPPALPEITGGNERLCACVHNTRQEIYEDMILLELFNNFSC